MTTRTKITMGAVEVFRCSCGGHPCDRCRKLIGSMCDASRRRTHCPHCGSPVKTRVGETPRGVNLSNWRPDNVRGS